MAVPPDANVSTLGDRAFGSNESFNGLVNEELPEFIAGSSGGGVGVRGGTGIDIFEAMVEDVVEATELDETENSGSGSGIYPAIVTAIMNTMQLNS